MSFGHKTKARAEDMFGVTTLSPQKSADLYNVLLDSKMRFNQLANGRDYSKYQWRRVRDLIERIENAFELF